MSVSRKRKIALFTAAIAGALMLVPSASKAGTIASWNFENPPDPIAVNNSPAPTVGTGTASSLGMNVYATPNVGVTTDDVLVGKSSDTGANGVADLSQQWRIRGQAGTNGAANGWSSAAPIGTQGAVFAVSTPASPSPLNVSFDWYSTTQGEANLELAYTLNDTVASPTWINVPITLSGSDSGLAVLTNSGSDTNTVTGSYVSDNLLTNGALAGQDWFTDLTATISDPNALNDPNFAIGLLNASTGVDCISTQGTALNNNSGNWRFDNVVITAGAVPEPASISLLALGALPLMSRRRKRTAAR
jgi:hypothetical protein